MIDPSIFKAYDIRGTYPDQLNEDVAYKIGRAFVEHLEVKQVAVGHDMRLSAPNLKPHLFQGISDAGASVIDLGMVGTEVMYFAVGHYGYESGIMLTASHNPKEYNGMKMVSKGSIPMSGDSGIYQVRDLVVGKDYQKLNTTPQVSEKNPYPDYKTLVRGFADLDKAASLKIVIDAGNGMGGQMFNNIFDDIGADVIPMYFEPDGDFPNHQPYPVKEENVEELKRKVVSENANLGIAYDGDGDRVVFIDEQGKTVEPYYLVAILAKKLIGKKPGGKIVFDFKLKWAVEDAVKEVAGEPIPERVGHSFIKARMREVDAIFGGESSAHYYYKDAYFADSSMITTALVLELVANGNKLSELLAPYHKKYPISGEINYEVEDAEQTISKVKEHFVSEGHEIDEMDGIAVDVGKDWRFSLRMSNTEPLVRLNIEAKSQELVGAKVGELESLIGGERESH